LPPLLRVILEGTRKEPAFALSQLRWLMSCGKPYHRIFSEIGSGNFRTFQ
jgi:hypothetical protein